ncbi:hypothetical protein LINPERHAP1_LOCUS41096 [Linum perenne]
MSRGVGPITDISLPGYEQGHKHTQDQHNPKPKSKSKPQSTLLTFYQLNSIVAKGKLFRLYVFLSFLLGTLLPIAQICQLESSPPVARFDRSN